MNNNNCYTRQEVLQLQRDCTTGFVTLNNKSDLQTYSRSLAFVPFHRPFILVVHHCNYVCILYRFPLNVEKSRDSDPAHLGVGGHPETTNLKWPTCVKYLTEI